MNTEMAEITSYECEKHSAEQILRAVYALNMCTVSVSQIIDYNDIYVLEQEYDAILNNLNLENMPKANALKKILIELLNTITFFRIQDIRKTELEKKYQKRVKNAIWKAIPNMSMIVAGDPVSCALSIATQVGIGYMNYRNEKAAALTDKEKEQLELRITALEQFHALRRELFTTAWELAEEYEFEDRLRLTEKQIKQYNQILMDKNVLRKYARLEAIQERFEAFPPFWYHFGHTASFIAGNEEIQLSEEARIDYRNNAKAHFAQYEKINKFNILREDQMAAAFALEYADLLIEDKENPDKVIELITTADKMSGTALDIKQLCAIAYLKVGDTLKAAKLLKQLVNEEYNTLTNAKILSRIYVSQVLKNDNQANRTDYETLVLRIGKENKDLLYPMPERTIGIKDENLMQKYMIETKTNLISDYIDAITGLMKKYTIKFNEVIVAPYGNSSKDTYYDYTDMAYNKRLKDMEKILSDTRNRNDYLENLADIDYRFRYLDLINEALIAYDDLSLWKNSPMHSTYMQIVRSNILEKQDTFKEIQDHIVNKTFSVNEYQKLQLELSFYKLLDKMFDAMKEEVITAINTMNKSEQLDMAENELLEFCKKHDILLADSLSTQEIDEKEVEAYITYDLLGTDGKKATNENKLFNHKKQLARDSASGLLNKYSKDIAILLPDDLEFEFYFKNQAFKSGSLKDNTIAIIDDKSKKNIDVLLAKNTLIIIKRNKIKAYHSYNSINYKKNDRVGECLVLGIDEFYNNQINMVALYDLINKLRNAENHLK